MLTRGKVAVLHTVVSTTGSIGRLINECLPGAEVLNFLDDSILPMLMRDPSMLPYAYEKMMAYSHFAERQGCRIIVGACSSVGEFAEYVRGKLNSRFVRIDDAVTDIIAGCGGDIVVLATLVTTLRPSAALIERKYRNRNASANTEGRLVAGAYDAIQVGDIDRHNALIREAAMKALSSGASVYLAQASMAAALEDIPESEKSRVYTSPIPMVDSLKAVFEEIYG